MAHHAICTARPFQSVLLCMPFQLKASLSSAPDSFNVSHRHSYSCPVRNSALCKLKSCAQASPGVACWRPNGSAPGGGSALPPPPSTQAGAPAASQSLDGSLRNREPRGALDRVSREGARCHMRWRPSARGTLSRY